MIKLEEFNNHLKTISPQDWNRLFNLIPVIEDTKIFSRMGGYELLPDGSHTFPYTIYAEVVNNFINLINDLNLAPAFNYIEWKEGSEIIKNKNFDMLDTIIICKLFTVMVRTERFSDGVIGIWFKEGIILGLLKRLQEINPAHIHYTPPN